MLHWPSSGGAFAALGAALPTFGVGGANAWPISSRVNTSLSGTGAGMTCEIATKGASEKLKTKAITFMTIVPTCGCDSPWGDRHERSCAEQPVRIDDEFLRDAAVEIGVPLRCLIQRDDLDID